MELDLIEIHEVILWVVFTLTPRLNLWVKTSAFKDGPKIQPSPTFLLLVMLGKSKQKARGRNFRIVSAA